ncbi:hypothetical protein GN958_ATG18939, partial [Phytophthora infestans]
IQDNEIGRFSRLRALRSHERLTIELSDYLEEAQHSKEKFIHTASSAWARQMCQGNLRCEVDASPKDAARYAQRAKTRRSTLSSSTKMKWATYFTASTSLSCRSNSAGVRGLSVCICQTNQGNAADSRQHCTEGLIALLKQDVKSYASMAEIVERATSSSRAKKASVYKSSASQLLL